MLEGPKRDLDLDGTGLKRDLDMKFISIAAIAFAAVAVVAALALVFGIPVGFLTGAVAKRIQDETGYRMVVAGNSWLTLRPSLRLQINDVALIDDSERTPRRRLSAQGVRVNLSVWSLISGRPRLTDIAVVKPTIVVPLVRDRTGAASAPAAGDGARRATSGPEISFDRFVVENGTIIFADSRGGVENRLEHVEATALRSGSNDNVEVRATARAGAHTVGFSASGKIPGLRFDQRSIPLSFSLEAPGLLQDIVPGSGELKVEGSSIAINDLAGAIGQNKFNGWLTVDFTSKPLVRVALAFERLDVAPVKSQSPPSVSIETPASLNQPWSDQQIDLGSLNFFDAEVQFASAELNVDRYRFAPISVAAILGDGVLQAAVTKTDGYGGRIQGTLSIDSSGPDPVHALRVDVVGVEALPFLSAVADFPYLDGRMVAKIDAHGRGSSPRAVMSSLSGAVALRFDNGEIRGVDVSQMVRTLAAKILSGWNESRAEKTELTEMSAFFRMQDGRATTDNLRLVGPLVRMSGAGTADIGTKMLAFRLDPKIVMSLEGQGSAANPVGLGVPVVVQGPWGAPRIYPEIAGILDNPDAAFGQLRELGSGLLKGSGLPKLPGGLSLGGSGSGGSASGGSLSGGSLTQGIESLFGSKDGGKQSPLPNLRQGR